MKYTVIAAAIAVAGLQTAFATTTITPFNGVSGGSNTTQVVDNTGAPLLGATVSVGTFASPAGLDSAGSVDLNAFGWTEFASTVTNGAGSIAPGIFGAFGSPGATGALPTTPGGDFFDGAVGRSIFVVIGDGAGEFIIWQSGEVFATEDATLGGAAVSFNVIDANLLRGDTSQFTNNGLAGPPAGGNGSAAVTFVPEPTSSLLFGVAGLALLIRRKR